VAFSAAYTALNAQPDNARMKDNVKFYQSLPEAMSSNFVDLEAKPYQVTACIKLDAVHYLHYFNYACLKFCSAFHWHILFILNTV